MVNDFAAALSEALRLIASADAQLAQIVALSVRVSLAAVAFAALAALPLGALLAITRFPGRQALVAVLNALMEVTRAGGKTVFVRGIVTGDGTPLLSFSGIIRKTGKRADRIGD